MALYPAIKGTANRIFDAWIQMRDNIGLNNAEANEILQELLVIANQMEQAIQPPPQPPPPTP